MSTSLHPKLPKYVRLVEHLREQIVSGELRPGDRLPPLSRLRAEHAVSLVTMEKVYSLLEAERLIVREQGRGTFVARRAWAERPLGLSGLTFGFIRQYPYWLELLGGVEEAAHAWGRELLMLADSVRDGADAPLWDGLDGVLLLVRADPDELAAIPPGVPCVSVIHGSPRVDSVVADDAAGVRLLIEHLLGLGHRRIGYLIDTTAPPSLRRREAWLASLSAAGIPVAREWERAVRKDAAPEAHVPFVERGRSAMQRWLAEDPRLHGCTAVLAQNDDVALGAVEALQAAGRRVPGDVSVAGFDGTGVEAGQAPRLTTVKVPLRDIGMAAVARLLERSQTPGAPPEEVILPVRLRIGASTGPAH